MNFVFLMDPLERVIPEKDTSFILMLEAHRRGHTVSFVTDGGISLVDGEVRFRARRVVPQTVKGKAFVVDEAPVTLTPDVADAVFIRSDPPFDEQYLMNTWLLDHLPPRTPVINRPAGVRSVNEKIWAARFRGLVPPTVISRDRDVLREFLAEHEDAAAKPTGGFGGQSVFRVRRGDVNTNVILEDLTRAFTRDIILQKFVPESDAGDKRILLLDGEPLGAVLRVHAKDDFRNNFFSGGKPVKASVDERDREIIRTLKPYLKELGLHFVGIDVMGRFLIEVNVTSPTCLQEINALDGVRLEERVIDSVEILAGKQATGPEER